MQGPCEPRSPAHARGPHMHAPGPIEACIAIPSARPTSVCCDHAGRQHRREPTLHVIPFPPSKPAARATRLVARDMHGPRCWDNNDRLQRRPQDIAYVSRRTMDRRGLPRDDHRPRQRRGCALQPRQASAYGADLQQRGDRCNWPCQRNQVHHPDRGLPFSAAASLRVAGAVGDMPGGSMRRCFSSDFRTVACTSSTRNARERAAVAG